MKDIDEITRLTDGELERIASDERVEVPPGLQEEVLTALKRKRAVRRPMRFVLSALCPAAAAVVLCVLLADRHNNALYAEPKDSFDDPYEAYACLQSTFERISSSVCSTLENSAPVVESGIRGTAAIFSGSDL